ncbi:hypothetical protein [Paenibacillus periandrae]|uniref:hypothetical protein n=1 Tax=Paenibacillus periandrae TaxID=1761741 RepID=UPI001F0971E8|nr:hypothetical protein [Paenibacillus periandrae]
MKERLIEMSWDISLKQKEMLDVEVADIGNYTYNVSKMYVEAMGQSLSAFNGVNAGESTLLLRQCVEEMISNPEKYKAMNPPNGWGNYEGALAYVQKLLHECEKNPNSTIEVS